MKRLLIPVILVMISPLTSAWPQDVDPSRWIGVKAPEFRLAGTDGATHTLESFLERGPLVIVWFPKAYTGNVDRLLKSVDTVTDALARGGVTVVAASCDKTKYLTPYTKQLGLSFPILADPTRTAAIRWGAVGEGREIPRRWAYFIDRTGKIVAVRSDLDAANAGAKILERARELGWSD